MIFPSKEVVTVLISFSWATTLITQRNDSGGEIGTEREERELEEDNEESVEEEEVKVDETEEESADDNDNNDEVTPGAERADEAEEAEKAEREERESEEEERGQCWNTGSDASHNFKVRSFPPLIRNGKLFKRGRRE